MPQPERPVGGFTTVHDGHEPVMGNAERPYHTQECICTRCEDKRRKAKEKKTCPQR